MSLTVSPTQSRKITCWTDDKPISFKVFRQRQARLVEKGYHAVIGSTTSRACPACGCTERVNVALVQGRDETASYDICVQCWSAVNNIPVYEDE